MSRMPILLLLSVCLLSGCASLVGSATSRMADDIALAIRNQNDPSTVRDGAPAYLLMIDGLIAGDPENTDLLLAGAGLYGSYSGAFVDDEARAAALADKALAYARRALCLELGRVCEASGGRLDEFTASLAATDASNIEVLYSFATSWAGWVQANASDWNAVADLAKVEALFAHCLAVDERHDGGGAHVYLGVIKTLRPAALGGEPEIAREHFERAIEISAAHNLMYKVLMARHYARNVFDRELHDRLLNEVLEAEAEYPGLTLVNTLARREAEILLAEGDDFF
ncbi:MAG TPA: TRAP transporter TatT component family protein [Gammaproteobacteria bacterium]